MSESILEAEVQVSNIMKDLRGRITAVYDKYTVDNGSGREIPKLPDFDVLIKNGKLRYSLAKRLTDCVDELNALKLRVTIVRRDLSSLRRIQSTGRSDYNLVANFRKNLETYEEELSGYRYDLSDLIKNAYNKFRVVDSLQFYNE